MPVTPRKESEWNYDVVCGYINGLFEIDRNLAESILDESVTDHLTCGFFPILQTSVNISEKGVKRLHKSLDLQLSPVWMFSQLAYDRKHKDINDQDLSTLLMKIATLQGGIEVALEILHMRVRLSKDAVSDSIRVTGQDLILRYEFSRDNKALITRIEKIIRRCFEGDDAKRPVRILCEKIVNAINNYDVFTVDISEILDTLAAKQSKVFLNVFLENIDRNVLSQRDLFDELDPVSYIDHNFIVSWCEMDPKERYSLIASVIIPYIENKNTEKLQWTKLSKTLISKFYNPNFILEEFKTSFHPRSWSGSLADSMERKLDLIVELETDKNDHVRNWANEQRIAIQDYINETRKEELLREKERNERLE